MIIDHTKEGEVLTIRLMRKMDVLMMEMFTNIACRHCLRLTLVVAISIL